MTRSREQGGCLAVPRYLLWPVAALLTALCVLYGLVPPAPLEAQGQTPTGPPNTPVLFAPANGSGGATTSPTLDVSVTDPAGSDLMVTFYGRVAGVVGTSFSIIPLPDTQYYSAAQNGGTPAMFNTQTTWIVNNQNALKIAYVAHLGDIVQSANNNGNDTEWINADTALRILEDGNVPFGLPPGNHDMGANASGTGNTALTESFNRWFGVSRFSGRPYYGGHYSTTNDNHYDLFTAGGMEFIVIHFAYDTSTTGARFQGVLAWADAVLKKYSNRRAILVSHYILNSGNPATFGAQGQALFNALRNNPNLFLLHSGHIHSPTGQGRRSDTFNGNVIQSVMSDFQDYSNGGNGWLRTMTFSPAANQIQVQTYSPVLNQYLTDSANQFTLPLNMQNSGYTNLGSVSIHSGNRAALVWDNRLPGTQYEWYAVASNGSFATTGPTWNFTTASVPAPQVTLSPTSLTFSAQVLNTSSAPQSVQLTNSGNASLNISGINTSSDYAQTSTCGGTVAAGASCNISVTFIPTKTGADNGSLVINDDVAGGSSQTVNLFGTGFLPVAPAITSANSTSFTDGVAGTFAVTATGTPAPTFSRTGTLPGGVTFSAAGTLSGTPVVGTAGTYPIVITAQNGVVPNATQSFTLTVLGGALPPPPPAVNAAYSLNASSGTMAADLSGNGNNGTLLNGVAWTTAGKYGGALSFDGSDDFVSVPDAATLDLGTSGTIEAWVRLNAINRWNGIMAKGNANSDPAMNYALEVNSSNRFVCTLGSGSAARVLTATTTVATGTFYHVACVWTGSQLQLYINGGLNTSVAQNLTPAANSSPLYIGQYGGNVDRISGVIDEVRIYNRALGQTEISADMNTAIAPPGPPPGLSGLNPSSGMQGMVMNVVISGSNFLSGATCSFGSGITLNSCAFNSAAQLTAGISISAGATVGPRTVTVNNPGGQSASLSNGFTVDAAPPPPAPVLNSVSPISGQQAQTLGVTLTGANFLSGAACSFGAGITVNSCVVNSATQIAAGMTIAGGAATGPRSVTVTNPDGQATTLASAFTVDAAPPPPPPPAVNAAYSLNASSGTMAADLSGNGNNGTLLNGVAWTTAGKYGGALSFDGSDDFISVPDAATLDLGTSGTIEAWVRLNAINRWNGVIAKGNANSDPAMNYALEVNNSNRFVCTLGSGSAARVLTATTTVATGTIYHVACVWTGSQLQLYINGTLNTSVAQNLTPAANSSPLYIGQYGGNVDRISGVIDEVRIYGRALSQTEVQADMNTVLAP